MFRRLVAGVCALLLSASAHAAVNIVATTASMGMLARTVGGDRVRVTVLAPPDRDAHSLQAKPSMILAARRADLVIAVGAELEIGWLPAVLQSAANGRILPGQPGYVEAAALVPLLEAGETADRSRGDVHPRGNPHLYLDPQRMVDVARALAGRLAALDAPGASQFRARAEAFASAVAGRVPVWKQRAQGAPGAVLYHKDGNYLMAFLEVPVLGYIEPLPGVPPTASQLRDLVQRLKGRQGTIVFATGQPSQGPEFLAKALGWPVAQLPLEPGIEASTEDYLNLIDRWVTAVAGPNS